MLNLTRTQLEDAIKYCYPEANCSFCSCKTKEGCVGTGKNLAQTSLTLLDMLKRLEWMHNFDSHGKYCPVCEMARVVGHKPDCELGNLLKEVEG